MDIKELFECAKSDWICYSKYEIKEKDGVEYLTPAVKSDIEVYNPLDNVEHLIVTALNMGRLLCRDSLTKGERDALLINYAENFGPMGFMTAIPLNGNFFEYGKVFFGRNSYFDVDEMESIKYRDTFKPFGIKEGQSGNSALFTNRYLEYVEMFSRNYCERVDWLVKLFSEFYMHFSACKEYEITDNPALKNAYAETAESFREYGLGFRMKMNSKPTIEWDFNSLKVTVETIYSFLISQPDTPLRMCKHCGKAFYATHGRSEFCDAKCRNQYNVYKFRGKKKQGE